MRNYVISNNEKEGKVRNWKKEGKNERKREEGLRNALLSFNRLLCMKISN